MNIDRATDFEKEVMKRAWASGDALLSKAVIHLVNQSVALRWQNAQLHLGVNPYIDARVTDMNRLARHTRKIIRHLQKVTELLPDKSEFKNARLTTKSFIAKAEWAFRAIGLPSLLKDEEA